MTQFTLSAWAKINLGLRITGKRPDGFHDLLTRFQRLSLCDIVSLYPSAAGISYVGQRLTDKPEQNLTVRAAEAYNRAFGGGGVTITVTKRIPAGAGLGGGSSDAAAVLRGMAMMYGTIPEDPRLLEVGAEIGSDVPFFLLDESSAIGESKGEKLTIVEGLSKNLWVAILYPGFEISTTRAYKEFDNTLTPPIESDTLKVHSLHESEAGGSRIKYHNDFEKLAFEAHPELNVTCSELIQAGALSAGLAGSGSSLFAIFDDEAKARSAATQPRGSWIGFVCRPV